MPSSGRWLLLVGLAGCNQVLGNDHVSLTPPAVFDAPIDAPFACQPIGETPRFSHFLHQFQFERCTHYSVVGDHVVADCFTTNGAHAVFEGTAGGDLKLADGIATSANAVLPRLSPDGAALYVHIGTDVIYYQRTGASWTAAASTGIPVETEAPYSTAARGDGGDRLIVPDRAAHTLIEYEQQGAAWHAISTRPYADLGILSTPTGLAMTLDGLRLVVATPATMIYADRPSLTAPWRAEPLDAPSAFDAFLTDDCARIYMSGLGSIFYAQRS